jgi:SH3 domain protein
VKNLFILAVCFLGLAGNAVAETLYVSDTLEITMRSGKGTNFGITRMLRSGTPVEVLATDKKSGYTQVRTKSGKEGWVLSRFLMNGQAARDRLATAEKNLAELELENRKLTTAMTALTEEKSGLETNLQELEGQSRGVSQELSEIRRTASSALAIDSENKDLKGRMVSLERQLQTVQQENETLKDRTARDWFMVGAAVVLLGIIVGLIIPKIRFRKKSSWDTF